VLSAWFGNDLNFNKDAIHDRLTSDLPLVDESIITKKGGKVTIRNKYFMIFGSKQIPETVPFGNLYIIVSHQPNGKPKFTADIKSSLFFLMSLSGKFIKSSNTIKFGTHQKNDEYNLIMRLILPHLFHQYTISLNYFEYDELSSLGKKDV
jgi:hypothetical protein